MRKKRNLRKKIFYILAIILAPALLTSFFLQQNKLVQERNLFEDYTKKTIELVNKNGDLEMNFLEKNHLEKIETIAKELNFEKAGKIRYIRVLGGTVVAK